MVILNDHEIDEIIAKSKIFSPGVFYPIFLLVRESAAKTSDLLSLQWKDIQFSKNTAILVRSKELQSRQFQISDDLMRSLKSIERVSDLVFTHLNGKGFQKHVLGRELKRFQKHANVGRNWGLRDLRASYGVNFLRAGGNVRDLQKIMGHTRPYQTEEIYGHYQIAKSILSGSAAVQESVGVSLSDNEF